MLRRTLIRRQLPRICVYKPWRLLADHLFSPGVYSQIPLTLENPEAQSYYGPTVYVSNMVTHRCPTCASSSGSLDQEAGFRFLILETYSISICHKIRVLKDLQIDRHNSRSLLNQTVV